MITYPTRWIIVVYAHQKGFIRSHNTLTRPPFASSSDAFLSMVATVPGSLSSIHPQQQSNQLQTSRFRQGTVSS